MSSKLEVHNYVFTPITDKNSHKRPKKACKRCSDTVSTFNRLLRAPSRSAERCKLQRRLTAQASTRNCFTSSIGSAPYCPPTACRKLLFGKEAVSSHRALRRGHDHVCKQRNLPQNIWIQDCGWKVRRCCYYYHRHRRDALGKSTGTMMTDVMATHTHSD